MSGGGARVWVSNECRLLNRSAWAAESGVQKPVLEEVDSRRVQIACGDLGWAVRQYREKHGVAQETVAAATGLSIGTISRVERGLGMTSDTASLVLAYLWMTATELNAVRAPAGPSRPRSRFAGVEWER